MSVDCRRLIVKRALKYARQQQSAKKKTTDTLGLVLRNIAMMQKILFCEQARGLDVTDEAA